MPTDLGVRFDAETASDAEALVRDLMRLVDRLEIEIEQLKRRIEALERR